MDLQEYTKYLAENYEETILSEIEVIISSALEYDDENFFTFVRIPREFAFICKDIMKWENFYIRKQILHNIQAGRGFI